MVVKNVLDKLKPFDQELLDACKYIVEQRGGYVTLPFMDTPQEREALADMNKALKALGMELIPIASWALESGGPLNGIARVRVQELP